MMEHVQNSVKPIGSQFNDSAKPSGFQVDGIEFQEAGGNDPKQKHRINMYPVDSQILVCKRLLGQGTSSAKAARADGPPRPLPFPRPMAILKAMAVTGQWNPSPIGATLQRVG